MTISRKLVELSDHYEQEIIDLRRWLHQYPELAFQENKTADHIKRIIEDLGVEVRSGIAKTGLVADLHGKKRARRCCFVRTWTPYRCRKKRICLIVQRLTV